MKYNIGDKIILSKGYRDRAKKYWPIPLALLDKQHEIKETYTNKENTTWIYFGEKDLNGNRIYVRERDVRFR